VSGPDPCCPTFRGWSVLHAIDRALIIRDRHPTLFADQLQHDRDCGQLGRAWERYKRMREPPAGQDRWDDPEASRVDQTFEEEETARRRRHWEARKPERDRARRDELARMEWGELADWIRTEVATISTVGAANIEASSAGSGHPSKNLALDHSGAREMTDDPRWRRRANTAKRTLLALADLILEAQGGGTHADAEFSTVEVSRAVLTRGVGMSCREAADECRDLPGVTGAFVARVRRNQGSEVEGLDILGYKVSVIDGERQMPTDGARRVVIEP
jgi:hypothetical protein